jgi:hypothetical protein
MLPYVGLVSQLVVPHLKRRWDTREGCTMSGDPYSTRQTGMQAFKDLYSGQPYVIHFKHSQVLNSVYVTMMYGLGMPILFPVAAFNLFNNWVSERLTVAYLVKQPPALDETLTTGSLDLLRWAPMLFLFNGYWMVTNTGVFPSGRSQRQQEADANGDTTCVPRSAEEVLGVTGEGTVWALPIVAIFAVSVFIMAAKLAIPDRLRKWGFTMSSTDIEVDEDLPNFFEAVRLSASDELIDEN